MDDGSGIILTSFTNPSLSSLDASAITRFAVGDGGDVAAAAAASSIGEEAVGIEDVSSQEFSEEALSVGGEESAPFGEREPRRPALLLWNGAVVDVCVGEEEAEATGDADADVVIIGGGGAALKAPPRDNSDSTPKARRGSGCSGADEAMAAVVGKEGRWAGKGSTPLTTTPSPLGFGERREK